MGKHKRKRDKSTGELRRKIKKLEKQIEKRHRSTSSSSNSYSDEQIVQEGPEPAAIHSSNGIDLCASDAECLLDDEVPIYENNEEYSSGQLQSVVLAAKDQQIQLEDASIAAASEETPSALREFPSIPPEILSMLGESKKPEETSGKKIPQEISERWGKIILEGLAKEAKEDLLHKTLIPENFQLAKAPKLNAEVASILTESSKNRDKRLEKTQNQLGLAIARLVNLTTELINSDMNKIDIIKQLSETNQILLDLHYEETLNRRRLIIPLLDKSFWSIISGVKRDIYLFGENLSENIKTTKTIERSSQQIKKLAVTANTRKGNQPGNFRGPPRQPAGGMRPAPPLPPPPAPSARYYPAGPMPAQTTRRPPATAQSMRGRPPPRASRSYDRRIHR